MKLTYTMYGLVSIVVSGLLTTGCGHSRAKLQSSSDIFWASSSEYLIEVSDLPLEYWPKLQKFTALSDLRITSRMGPAVVDKCLLALSRLRLPKLRALRMECSASDAGLRALTNLPSISCLDLVGPYITDDGIRTVSSGMPNLQSVAFTRCAAVTASGLLTLTNAPALREVLMSLDNLTQEQVERIITEVHQVTYWGFNEPTWRLVLEPLKRIKDQRNLTIVIMDGYTGRGIDEFIETRSRMTK